MKILLLIGCICASLLLTIAANAYVLTFDDTVPGAILAYYSDHYGATFSDGFQVADHTGFARGLPHSEPNVLIWTGVSLESSLWFGNKRWDGSGTIPHYSISSFSAYFSTDEDVLIRMYGYRNDPVYGPIPVVDKLIGDPGQSWDNVPVELRPSDGGVIDYVVFQGEISSAARLGFCADDMTIVPVSEPASLLALCVGLIPLVVRRRRG